MKPRALLTEQEAAKVDWLKGTSPAFAMMRQLAMRFRGILRGSDPSKLDRWLDDAHHAGLYGIRRFVLFLRRDIEAVRNAISETWSNAHDSPHFQLPFYRAQPAGTLPDATYCS
jgi:transposase